MKFATADLCDACENDPSVHIAAPLFTDYGGKRSFCGQIVTVKVFEDNVLVRAALEEAGQERVLVVDGGASLNCALLGDQVAQLACDNGWAGLVINGCIRDSSVIAAIPLGVKALNTSPRRSKKEGKGEKGVAVHFADVTFHPGHYLYADADGIVIAPRSLLEAQ